jgi:hypothetical protein
MQAKEASKAVDEAVAALPDSTLKDSLKASLSEVSAKLLQQLQSQEEQIKQPAKRAKPAAPPTTQQMKKKKPSRQSRGAAAPEAPTLMDCNLEAAVAAILRGTTPRSYTTVAIAPLISRFPPPEGLIEWHLLRSNPAAGEEDWVAQIDLAEKALPICNALATQAPSSEHALAVFEPALAQMLRAVEALEAATSTSLVEEGEQAADASREIASGWEQLKLLSTRAVMCMNLTAKEISIVNHADDNDIGAEADRNTRWWLSYNSNLSASEGITDENGGSASLNNSDDGRSRGHHHHSGDVTNIAQTACSVAVSLCTVARLRTLEGDDSLHVDALAAHAAHDMKILSPYAAMGQVTAAAEAVLGEVNKTTDDAMLFLALYMAAVESSDAISGELYFLRMLAARNASAAASFLGNTAVAARVLSSAATAPPPPAALEWLREQPPSRVILQALDSLQRGPQGLSAHLIYEAPERAVMALAAAAKALAVGASGGGDGDGGQDSTPADDLLFFVSKEGDGGAFNCQDWGSEREEGAEVEDGRAGLVIDDLPDEGKSMSEEEDYNEDSDDDDE